MFWNLLKKVRLNGPIQTVLDLHRSEELVTLLLFWKMAKPSASMGDGIQMKKKQMGKIAFSRVASCWTLVPGHGAGDPKQLLEVAVASFLLKIVAPSAVDTALP